MAVATSGIKQENVAMKKGFTLVEIMIVVAIIALLAVIAIPGFLRARENSRKNACIDNLRQIEWAKDEYAMEYGLREADPIPGGNEGFTSLVGVQLYIKEPPVCPTRPDPDSDGERTVADSAADYIMNGIGNNPQCDVMGDDENFPHELPPPGSGS